MDNLKATYYNVNFNKFREKMVHNLFHFYNVAVFDSKVWHLLMCYDIYMCCM